MGLASLFGFRADPRTCRQAKPFVRVCFLYRGGVRHLVRLAPRRPRGTEHRSRLRGRRHRRGLRRGPDHLVHLLGSGGDRSHIPDLGGQDRSVLPCRVPMSDYLYVVWGTAADRCGRTGHRNRLTCLRQYWSGQPRWLTHPARLWNQVCIPVSAQLVAGCLSRSFGHGHGFSSVPLPRSWPFTR